MASILRVGRLLLRNLLDLPALPALDAILLEDGVGNYMLTEDGSKILLE